MAAYDDARPQSDVSSGIGPFSHCHFRLRWAKDELTEFNL
jgi:hypothetical protein